MNSSRKFNLFTFFRDHNEGFGLNSSKLKHFAKDRKLVPMNCKGAGLCHPKLTELEKYKKARDPLLGFLKKDEKTKPAPVLFYGRSGL